MRVFAVSDIHVDYDVNAHWIDGISMSEYQDDTLILAGDVTDRIQLFDWCLSRLAKSFRRVLFVPGNHDLWVVREKTFKCSLEKLAALRTLTASCGASMDAVHENDLSLIPLLGWYDYSFGNPCDQLKAMWMDYVACRWPVGFEEREIAQHFDSLNAAQTQDRRRLTITFSHFMPRLDLLPSGVPEAFKFMHPILGTSLLERQVRSVQSMIHVYGHSHLNRRKTIDGVTYINNALGYPSEPVGAARKLLCIYEH